MRSSATACQLIPFPLVNRVGRIRDVARKMLDKQTDRHSEYYRDQTTKALLAQLERIGVDVNCRDAQLAAFWQAVQCEMLRLNYQGNGTGGAT